jgi:hypothetical protein
MFGQLNASSTVTLISQKLVAVRASFEDGEDVFQWLSAYTLTDMEGSPLNLPSDDAQDILNAVADVHDLYQTGLGVTGFPTASLPYNFFASMRMVTGAR